MRVLPLHELMHLTRIELCNRAARITNAWPDSPDRSEAQQNALINLRLIGAYSAAASPRRESAVLRLNHNRNAD